MADPQRADAQRNRTRILDAAYAAFTADPEVSLNAIAKRAGVGPGTLYRHFPSREALLLAVYQQEIDCLGELVGELLQEKPPLDAFRAWARKLAELVRVKHGLGEALATPSAQAVIDATYGPVTNAIQQLLAAAVAGGDIRGGVDAADVLLLLSALWRVPAGEEGLAQADRILDMIVSSLASPAQ
ncbi:TetR/AcrR family transcriptional regulator [Mycolicibacterium mucogenicum]|uniref:TetR/AcrR family transcriptional regulator n=1 Tax=Mycolicibacterium mucogenicum TaxID=56689 RepID=UPI002269BA61|nr:TetR/AcrR family transcriptional regulator [Mycolicibacterium mucogenicum]MCX8561963.1 TetR/AcrR family transcriptional regulator [Mycolicibacterium mucogenicum]